MLRRVAMGFVLALLVVLAMLFTALNQQLFEVDVAFFEFEVSSGLALLIAFAKAVALMPSASVLVRAWSVVRTRSSGSRSGSIILSGRNVIGISLHQLRKASAVERRSTAGNGLNGTSELTWRHRPELLRRKPQHAQPETDRLRPWKRCHRVASPNVAWINSAAMRT